MDKLHYTYTYIELARKYDFVISDKVNNEWKQWHGMAFETSAARAALSTFNKLDLQTAVIALARIFMSRL